MLQFLKYLFGFCICFYGLVPLHAQISFIASASPSQISRDEYFTYRITIRNGTDIGQILPPGFSRFIVLSGPSQESGMSSINGHTDHYVALLYMLKPRNGGTIILNSALATIAGKQYKSNEVTLTVLKGNSAKAGTQTQSQLFDPFLQERSPPEYNDNILRKGDDITGKVQKNMQLRLEVNKTSCYVGEPIVAEYKLYSRLKSESKASQNPTFSGFSVIDMQQPDAVNFSTGKLNGREYNIYTLRKAQLYALQPGVISIESAEVENNIQFIKEEYAKARPGDSNLFDDFSGSLFPADALVNQKVMLKSIPINIIVKALPETNKPLSFAGAVGNYSIEASLQKPLFSTDESGKLLVTIGGKGNMQLLTSPDISWPAGIESFEPRLYDNLDRTSVPVSGNKKFEYSFSASHSGHYTVPPINFCFFDPTSATYKTVKTDSILFEVTKGTRHFSGLLSHLNNRDASMVNTIFAHQGWIAISVGGILFLSLTVLFIKKRSASDRCALTEESLKSTSNYATESSSPVTLKVPLEETQNCLRQNECERFNRVLNAELKAYLAPHISIDVNSINSGNIITLMDSRNVDSTVSMRLQRLMQEVEWQLYAPFESNSEMNEKYNEAMDIIKNLQEGAFRNG